MFQTAGVRRSLLVIGSLRPVATSAAGPANARAMARASRVMSLTIRHFIS